MVEPASREQLIKVLDALPQEAFADVAQYVDGVKRRYEDSGVSASLPQSETLDEAEYRLMVREKVAAGIEAARAGRSTPIDEVERTYLRR